MKIKVDVEEIENKTDLQKKIEQMKQEIEQNEMKKQQKIKELEELKALEKQKELKELKKQKELEEMKKQKQIKELEKQKELEEMKKQKELNEIQKQKEMEEIEKAKKQKEKENKNQELISVENYRPPTTVSIYHEQVMSHFFMLYEKLFYEYVQGKTIALVGPAESILGTGRGHIIDKFDEVMDGKGFKRVMTHIYHGGGWGDALYINKNII
jgi:Fe2+ transport system protein B